MPYVLIVDDDPDAREVLCHFLGRSGHECASASGGREALNSIFQKTPDLIVLDLLMPGMDGPDLLAVLRSYLRLDHIPVVVWTAAPDSPQAARVRRPAVKAMLTKGVATLADLGRAIDDALGASSAPAP